MRSRRKEVRDPLEVVQDHLARGVTGCLVATGPRGQWRVYVMQGEILAAHGPDDGEQLVLRLLNSDSISARQADALRAELAQGASFESLLLGRVPEDLFLDLLVQRFRQNVLDFLCCAGPPAFEPLEAVFVDNIQTGHDSVELLESLARVRQLTSELRTRVDELVVRVGRGAPRKQTHARVLDLAEPERLLSSLLGLSPFEDGVTLAAVAEMRDGGVVQLLELDELASVLPVVGPDADQLDPEEETQEVGAVDKRLAPVGEELIDLASDQLEPISDMLEPVLDPELEPELEPELPPPAGRTAASPGPSPAHLAESEPVLEPDLVPEPLLEPEPEPTAEAEPEDPNLQLAIQRAREIEERRAVARETLERDENGVRTRPPGFDWHATVDDGEMAFFVDQDEVRGGGQGQFSTGRELLDVVDLSAEGMAAFQRAMDIPVEQVDEHGEAMLEMAEASAEEAAHAVALNFSGPQLEDEDVRRKIDVVNDVLAEVVATLDRQSGKGSGRVGLQLLVDGPPTRFGPLFRGVKVDEQGRMDVERLVRNLRKRPPTEHRGLLNDGMMDLIQRTLSTSLEELDEDHLDQMLERIAGYQQRMGL